jgi:predicted nucleic acid-binding protein
LSRPRIPVYTTSRPGRKRWPASERAITWASRLRLLAVEDQYKISFWDALIVQAAETGGADVLYSEDLSHGQQYGNVRVVNPLK